LLATGTTTREAKKRRRGRKRQRTREALPPNLAPAAAQKRGQGGKEAPPRIEK
jgi:hypothetical protein